MILGLLSAELKLGMESVSPEPHGPSNSKQDSWKEGDECQEVIPNISFGNMSKELFGKY